MQRLQGCVVIFPRYDAIFALKRGKNATLFFAAMRCKDTTNE